MIGLNVLMRRPSNDDIVASLGQPHSLVLHLCTETGIWWDDRRPAKFFRPARNVNRVKGLRIGPVARVLGPGQDVERLPILIDIGSALNADVANNVKTVIASNVCYRYRRDVAAHKSDVPKLRVAVGIEGIDVILHRYNIDHVVRDTVDGHAGHIERLGVRCAMYRVAPQFAKLSLIDV